jgi:hypothetical protein
MDDIHFGTGNREFPGLIIYLAMHKDEESEPVRYEEALSCSDKSKCEEAIRSTLTKNNKINIQSNEF